MATGNLAAVLVAWAQRFADALFATIFDGCAESYGGRMSSSEEEHQVQLIRWVRQRIHEELEATKEETTAGSTMRESASATTLSRPAM